MSEESIENQPSAQPSNVEAPETNDQIKNGTSEEQGQKQEERRGYQKLVPLHEHVNVRRERNAFRDENAALKAELEAFRAGKNGATPSPQQDAGPKKPRIEDYADKTRDEYEADLDKWAEERDRIAERRAVEKTSTETRQTRFQEHAQAVTQSFVEAQQTAKAYVPDIDERVLALNDPDIVQSVHPSIWLDIMSSPAAIDLVVELTDDMRALERLQGNPIAAARELGRLEAQILARKEPTPTGQNPASASPRQAAPAATRTVREAAPATRTLAEVAAHGTVEEYEAARRSGLK